MPDNSSFFFPGLSKVLSSLSCLCAVRALLSRRSKTVRPGWEEAAFKLGIFAWDMFFLTHVPGICLLRNPPAGGMHILTLLITVYYDPRIYI